MIEMKRDRNLEFLFFLSNKKSEKAICDLGKRLNNVFRFFRVYSFGREYSVKNFNLAEEMAFHIEGYFDGLKSCERHTKEEKEKLLSDLLENIKEVCKEYKRETSQNPTEGYKKASDFLNDYALEEIQDYAVMELRKRFDPLDREWKEFELRTLFRGNPNK